MKKIFMGVLVLGISCYSFSQTSRCTDEMVLAKTAPWKYGFRMVLENAGTIPKAVQPEIIKRIDMLHQLVVEAYPQGIGTEPWYSRGADTAPENKAPYSYAYRSGYPFYYCSQNLSHGRDADDEKLKFMESHYNTTFYIYANHLPEALFRGYDAFKINGQQVYALAAVAGKWKGLDVFRHPGDGPYEMVVVIKREGKELPYHHVTRREYLDYMIGMQNKAKQGMLTQKNTDIPQLLTPEQEEEKKNKGLAQIEKDIINPAWREKAKKNYLANYKTSQQLREEYFNSMTVAIDKEIKKYRDEMSKSSDALLQSPAIVGVSAAAANGGVGSLVFSTEKEGGIALVTENPDYIDNSLPRYVPQYFVLYWQWWGLNAETSVRRFAAPEYFGKAINEKFPVEKIQALIDK